MNKSGYESGQEVNEVRCQGSTSSGFETLTVML